jgi:hypothetical protein
MTAEVKAATASEDRFQYPTTGNKFGKAKPLYLILKFKT